MIMSTDQDSRIYTFTLKDEAGADRNITGQKVKIVIYDPWNFSKLLEATGDVTTDLPAVITCTPDDGDVPAHGYYLAKLYIQEDDGGNPATITYSEPYKEFNCYVEQGPSTS
jgi:hypothetical protein